MKIRQTSLHDILRQSSVQDNTKWACFKRAEGVVPRHLVRLKVGGHFCVAAKVLRSTGGMLLNWSAPKM